MEGYYWTYIIYSAGYDKYYIGYSSDIEKRVAAHNHEKNKGYTKRYQPWALVYSKRFSSKAEAMRHEKYLKSLKNKGYLKEIIKEGR
jgi:putative endonuclease